MAEWAQARRDAKTSPVQLDVKSLLKDAMKDGFDHHMAGAFAPCLQVFSAEQAGFPTFHPFATDFRLGPWLPCLMTSQASSHLCGPLTTSRPRWVTVSESNQVVL
jgi:hypothetical protein